MKNKLYKDLFIFFTLGWLFIEATYSTGVVRLLIDESISPSKIEKGEEGQILTQADGSLKWDDNPIISSDTTLNIPDDFLTFDDVKTYLSRKRVVGATLTIKFSDGVYNLTSPLEFIHPTGRNIEIVGNTTTPAGVVFNCAKTCVDIMGGPVKKN